MGNRDAIKVCVNVEIKFWFMQKKAITWSYSLWDEKFSI